MNTAVQVTMYLNESDTCSQILQMLRNENVAGASAFHAVGEASSTGRNQVRTSGPRRRAGGNLPGHDRICRLRESTSPACFPNYLN